MRKLILNANGLVVNAVEAGDDFPAPEGHTFAPNADGDRGDTWTGSAWVKKVIPPPTAERIAESIEEAKGDVRQERDRLLETNVDKAVPNIICWNEMTPAEQAALSAYRQALLDVPEQAGFPENIDWPVLGE